MRNKKVLNIFKRLMLGMLTIITIISLTNLLVPVMYSLFISLLSISINLFSGVVIGGGILGIVVSLGLIAKCIDIKTEYVYDNQEEIDPDLMRENLCIVKSKDNERTSDNRYSYVYDNNYMDVDDIEIDDIMNTDWREEYDKTYNCIGIDIDMCDDSDVKIYTRKKNH